jgi:imidazole glycerol-phosphate synthase subunit HisH
LGIQQKNIIKMIGILNYGLGNINSISNIIKHVGGENRIISKHDDIEGIKKLIIPGVGSFDHGMQGLHDGKWVELLNEMVNSESIKVLGICLGMQLMCKSSEEGKLSGLGWIDAKVEKFSFQNHDNKKIPHMGWNTIDVVKKSNLFSPEQNKRFYFVHSYHVVCNDKKDISTTTDYGFNVTASFENKNVYGVQFHPEKSHRFGKELFKKFISI